MLRFSLFAAVVSLCATAGYGQNLDVIKQRRETMRAVSAASGPVYKMYADKASFDLAKVQSALKTMRDQLAKFKGEFPDNSKQGGDTEAKPTIWSDRAGFNGAIDAAINDMKKAAGEIKDEASFKKAYKPVAATCGGCHKVDGGYTIRLRDSFKKPKP